MVVVIIGRDKGKTGKVVAVVPKENKVVVEGVNVVKKHTKPSQKNPKGGILDITKAIDVSKLMVIDPKTGKPARIGYNVTANGKERVFKVGRMSAPAKAKKVEKKEEAKKEVKADTKEAKAGKDKE
jgi:large subunit ribosomal protein L24